MGEHERNQRSEIIAIMGATGSGKSSFINCLVGKQAMAVGHGLKSCTSNVQELGFQMDGRNGCLIDTPGFDDTDLPDTEILRRISTWLATTYVNGINITGIIYLRDIRETRMKGSSLKNFAMFQKLCGTDSLKNVLLVTTHWDQMNTSDGERREAELLEQYFQPMLDEGARTARHDNSPQSASACVRQLLGNPPTILTIQRQLVDQHMTLGETEAGAAVNEELTALKKKLEEDFKENLMNVETAANERMKRLLEEQNEGYRKELERIDAEKLELEKGSQHFSTQLLDLQKKLEEKAESSGKSTTDYLVDFLTNVTPIVAPIAMAAWAKSREDSASVPKPDKEIVYVDKVVEVPVFVQTTSRGPNLIDFLFG